MPVNRMEQQQCEAVSNDSKAKEIMKVSSDNKFKSTVSTLKPGDSVYLRSMNMFGKSAPVYDPSPFVIKSMTGTQAVITRGQQVLRRNISMLKKGIAPNAPITSTLPTASTRPVKKHKFNTVVRTEPTGCSARLISDRDRPATQTADNNTHHELLPYNPEVITAPHGTIEVTVAEEGAESKTESALTVMERPDLSR